MSKHIVITGATAGIGLSAARSFARAGHRLTLVGRSPEKLEATGGELRALGAADVDTETCDLSLVEETRRAAGRLAARVGHVDVLAHNAGAYFVDRVLTAEGIERTFATNHLAPFVLTQGLRDRLVASAPMRVVVTSSDAHRYVADLDLTDLQSERWRAAGFEPYARSKLANVYFTRELARRMEGTGVTAHCFHPGFVASDFAKNNGTAGRLGMFLLRPFARNVERGADTLVYLATTDDELGTGGYWFDRKKRHPSRVAQDDAVALRLWEETERFLATR